MRTLVRFTLAAAAFVGAAAGCGDTSSQRGGNDGPTAEAPAPSSQPRTAGVELFDVTFAGLDAAVKQNRGKVVLVDVWATFCAPCKKKFPHLVALHDKHAEDGLVLITVTIDAKDDREKALKDLRGWNATCVNFFLDDTDASMKKWEEAYPVEQLPVLIAYNRKGERVLLDFGKLGKDNPAELDAFVEKLLAEK